MKWLRYRADMQTVVYMLVATAVAVAHWRLDGFSVWLLAAGIVMAFSISAMHHNHAHVPIWTSSRLNQVTDLWFTLFQGHPGFAFEIMHVQNHHRYHNGPDDLTRTYLHHDSNNLPGLLMHPVAFASGAMPCVMERVRQIYHDDRKRFAGIAVHYFLLIAVDAALFWADPWKALYCVLAPQVAALYFLLISNYLQHAHADSRSDFNHSRNFMGLINPLCFNVGYHTAHHHNPALHWSELPALHRVIAPRIAPQLNEPSFLWYCLRVFVIGLCVRRCQTAPLQYDAIHLTAKSGSP